MPVISQKDQDLIRGLFEKEVAAPVNFVYFTQQRSPLSVPGHECQYCKETREILEEVSSLSTHLSLEVHDFVAEADLASEMGIPHIPAFELKGKNKGRVRFFGIPAGYEFSSLIEDIVDVSKGETKLSAATKAQLATLTTPVHIQVFITPT